MHINMQMHIFIRNCAFSLTFPVIISFYLNPIPYKTTITQVLELYGPSKRCCSIKNRFWSLRKLLRAVDKLPGNKTPWRKKSLNLLINLMGLQFASRSWRSPTAKTLGRRLLIALALRINYFYVGRCVVVVALVFVLLSAIFAVVIFTGGSSPLSPECVCASEKISK